MQKSNTARNNYLQAEVSTATPQKLQLLLVEAAIKNIHRTKKAWSESRFDVGVESLTVAQDIVSEILCSLDLEGNPAIAKQLASIYLFIFRRLAEGGMRHDETKLDDALRVLTSERETWRQVCDKFGSTTAQTNNSDNSNGNIRAGKNDAAEFTPSSQKATNSPTNNTNTISSGGYSKPTSPTTFAKPSGSYGIQTVSFAAKPSQLNQDSPTQNATKKTTPTGIQTNSSLASGDKKNTPQLPKPIRPNPYK
ncbi:MAG: flagellar export chaperone FliS [Planctomycetaceae bacterium]|jgi:flagellar protein FliS|nr:flagellar export chaperone FliS [Planctomycetaceae bacterium]